MPVNPKTRSYQHILGERCQTSRVRGTLYIQDEVEMIMYLRQVKKWKYMRINKATGPEHRPLGCTWKGVQEVMNSVYGPGEEAVEEDNATNQQYQNFDPILRVSREKKMWNYVEDHCLVQGRINKLDWEKLAERLGRTASACQRRIEELKMPQRGGFENTLKKTRLKVVVPDRTLEEILKELVAKLKVKGVLK